MDTVREAILNSGKSRNEISIDTGIDNTVLFRIFHGGSCSVATLEILCEYLGLELAQNRKKRK